ncbi:MAG: S8 family serine peptidase [Prevotella sp.]|nr:S8 family serine peptidase [Prevotella sp.]
MQRPLLLLTILLLSAASLHAATDQETARRVKYKNGPAYIYRITLTDKKGTGYSLAHPTRFLSKRSVERRKRQGLPVDSTDLPVSERYVRLIARDGVAVVGQSRWQNTLLIRISDTTRIRPISQLACVKSHKLVWQSPDSVSPTAIKTKYHEHFEERDSVAGNLYGQSAEQISKLKGDRLHDIGLRGEAMMIAVIDGGFKNVDKIPAFLHADIRGHRDFVVPASPSIFAETDHGTKVLSAMAVNQPYYYMGSAPRASYWLLRSEDQQTEQEVEEDYWTMAAEYADSVGCDLVNSSLGYNEYDHPQMSYHQWQLDGQTAFASRSAAMMARKGMILVNSAGNSGMGTWKKIGIPADADHILTVGAIMDDEPYKIAPFSSIGPTQDQRVKPDVVAIGAPARLVNGRGVIMSDMGTSFSAPIVCGLTACLWQALRHMTAEEVIALIRKTSNNYEHPDNIYGYGVPNFWRAYQIGSYKPL